MNFAGTKTAGTYVCLLGLAVNQNSDFLHIWFPFAVGSYVGVAVLLPKNNSLAADFTLGHFCFLLSLKVHAPIVSKRAGEGKKTGYTFLDSGNDVNINIVTRRSGKYVLGC